MTMKSLTTTLLLTLLAAPLAAEELSSMAVGRNGDLFTLRTGAFGDYFPGSTDFPAENPVLVLEQQNSAGAIQRSVVPTTDDTAPEEAPLLAFDDESGSLMLVWSARQANGKVAIRYGAWDGAWSAIGTILKGGSPALFDSVPTVAISRDAFPVRASELKIIVVRRTLFNLAWRDAEGVQLSPIVFVEGMPIGWNEIINLSTVLATNAVRLPVPAEGAIFQTLGVRSESARRSVVVTFGDPATGKLVEIEHRYRPMDINMVGPDVRNRIFRIADLYKPETIQAIDSVGDRPIVHLGSHGLGKDEMTALAEGIRGHMIPIGSNSSTGCSEDGQFHGSLVQIGILPVQGLPGTSGTDEMYLALVGMNSDEMTALPAGIRGHMIAIGQQSNACNPNASNGLGDVVYVGSGGEVLVVDPSGTPLTLETASLAGDNGNSTAMIQTSALWMRAEAPLPTSAGNSTWVFSGRATTYFLVAWLDGTALNYQLTTKDGWSDIFQLHLNDMSLEQGLSMLSQRLR